MTLRHLNFIKLPFWVYKPAWYQQNFACIQSSWCSLFMLRLPWLFPDITRVYLTSLTHLKMYCIGVCWASCFSIQAPMLRRKRLPYVLLAVRLLWTALRNVWVIPRHQASMSSRSADIESSWLSANWGRLWRQKTYFSWKSLSGAYLCLEPC